jgi:hypothetical protein
VDAIVLGAVGVLAFYLTFRSGQRGFYPFDQSIVFDGSYRVLSGEVPYRDFVVPFGPVAFWLHSVFFRAAGVSFRTYLVGSSTINAVAALLAAGIAAMLAPRAKLLRYLAAILTAVWFYPPFGTPWVDQTAFFFGMLALGAVLAGTLTEPLGKRLRYGLVAAAGVLAVLAALSKQNVGAFLFPLYPLTIVVVAGKSRRELSAWLGMLAVGAAACGGAFLAWVGLESKLGIFYEYFYKIPAGLGSERLGFFLRSWFALREPYFGGRGPALANVVTVWALGAGIAGLVAAGRCRDSRKRRRIAAASLVCAYLAAFQHLFINTTLNQPENGMGLMGVTFAGAAIATAWMLLSRFGAKAAGAIVLVHGRRFPAVAAVVLAAAALSLSISGVRIAMSRKAQDIFRGSTFETHLPVRGLETLIWAEPTRMGGYEISGDEVAALLRYLRERGENFMVFPDFTILYGLAGVPSPQPVLWFHDGVTYLREDTAELDEWIVRDLRRNQVRVFVLEQVAWFNSGERWSHFPRFRAYIREQFTPAGKIGSFSVYERTANPGSGSGSTGDRPPPPLLPFAHLPQAH